MKTMNKHLIGLCIGLCANVLKVRRQNPPRSTGNKVTIANSLYSWLGYLDSVTAGPRSVLFPTWVGYSALQHVYRSACSLRNVAGLSLFLK